MENENIWIPKGKGGGRMNWEIWIDIYTLYLYLYLLYSTQLSAMLFSAWKGPGNLPQRPKEALSIPRRYWPMPSH